MVLFVPVARPRSFRPSLPANQCPGAVALAENISASATGTVMAESKIPLRKWAIAIYLWSVSLKGVSSMKLHRDLKITQKSAWFLGHRLREAFSNPDRLFDDPVEIDETFMGGKRKNMPKSKRKTLRGRGAVGKTTVAGARDRKTGKVSAKVIDNADLPTLRRFVFDKVSPGATVYTDQATAYESLRFRLSPRSGKSLCQ